MSSTLVSIIDYCDILKYFFGICSDLQLFILWKNLLIAADCCFLFIHDRLLRVCLSSSSAERWMSAIKQMSHVFPSVLFILQSSTNRTFFIITVLVALAVKSALLISLLMNASIVAHVVSVSRLFTVELMKELYTDTYSCVLADGMRSERFRSSVECVRVALLLLISS